MRLGQLARKLSLRTSDIVDFLSKKSIVIEDGSNTKLEGAQVEIVIAHFAPNLLLQEIPEPPAEEIIAVAEITPDEMPITPTTQELVEEVSLLTQEITENSEVIKVPKIDLPGLKVLGKIDLPDSKKKAEESVDQTNSAPANPEPRKRALAEDRKPYTNRPDRTERRQSRNPIAQQREQEAQEERRKREEEAEQAKEQRTKNYYKKVKVSAPTRRASLLEEQDEQLSTSEIADDPKGWWARLMKWFRT